MMTRLSLFITTVGVVLWLGTPRVQAQVSYEFTNPAGGNWSNSANWASPPTFDPTDNANDVTFDLMAVGNSTLVPTVIDSGVGNPYVLPNGTSTPSVTLSELSLNPASTYGFSVSGGTLVFTPFSAGTGTDGSPQPQIYSNTASTTSTTSPASLLPLVVKSNVVISGSSSITAPFELIGNAVANSPAYGNYSIVLGGQIIGTSTDAIVVNVGNGGAMFTGNNNSFAGVVLLSNGSLLLEGANSLGRTASVINNGGSNTADGLQIKSDQGKSSLLGTTAFAIMPQQLGQIGYTAAQATAGSLKTTNTLGFIDVGDAIANGTSGTDTYNPGFLMFGFLNTITTVNAQITGNTAANELIKVGTGTTTFTGASGSNGYCGGLMIMNGGITVTQNAKGSGGLSGGLLNANGYGTFVLNAGGTFTVNNTSLVVSTPLNPTSAIYLNGGTFSTTGLGSGTATPVADTYGALTVGAGQTIFSMAPSTKGNVSVTFTSGTATGLGTLIAKMGVSGTDTSSLTFATAPTTVNGIVPWMLVSSTTGTAVPTDLAFSTAGVITAPTTYGASSLGGATSTTNVKDTSSGSESSSATAVNALVIAGPTSITQSGTLAITSGTVLNSSATSIAGGTLAFGTNGYFTNTEVNAGSGVTITSAITAGSTLALGDGSIGTTSATKAPITIGGGIAFSGATSTLAIDNGTVTLNSTVTGTKLTYLVGTNGNLAVPGGLSITTGQTLTGNGTVTGNVGIAGGMITPASMSGSPSVLTLTGNLTLANNSVYNWGLASVVTDTPVSTTLKSGTTAGGYTASWINSSGSLSLSGVATGGITVLISSLGANFASGTVYDWVPGSSYSWTIASFATGITGFSSSLFIVNSTAFNNLNPSIGSYAWSVTQVGNNLVLNATPAVPEPAGLLLVAGAGLGLGGLIRRRYRNRMAVAA